MFITSCRAENKSVVNISMIKVQQGYQICFLKNSGKKVHISWFFLLLKIEVLRMNVKFVAKNGKGGRILYENSSHSYP